MKYKSNNRFGIYYYLIMLALHSQFHYIFNNSFKYFNIYLLI